MLKGNLLINYFRKNYEKIILKRKKLIFLIFHKSNIKLLLKLFINECFKGIY